LRDRLVPLLKRAMIFRPGGAVGPAFERVVEVDERGVRVADRLAAPPGAEVWRGPRQNLRHVASADSFSFEELLPAPFDPPEILPTVETPRGASPAAAPSISRDPHDVVGTSGGGDAPRGVSTVGDAAYRSAAKLAPMGPDGALRSGWRWEPGS
ncbi:MAG TPA: hypothetical protein VF756_25610, partial [Thermoanaerobaculia bacterium]